MSNTSNDPVELSFDVLIRETDGAYLVQMAGAEHWIPKSQLLEWDEDDQTFAIPEWLAHEKGLI